MRNVENMAPEHDANEPRLSWANQNMAMCGIREGNMTEVKLSIPDDLWRLIRLWAEAAGQPPHEWVVTWLGHTLGHKQIEMVQQGVPEWLR